MIKFYKKFLLLVLTLLLNLTAFTVLGKSGDDLVEIMLLDNLDDTRGFCIDIRGHKYKAKIERGLQVHTCYSYQSKISVDQGLSVKRLKQKELFFPYFDVCVYPTSLNKSLRPCIILWSPRMYATFEADYFEQKNFLKNHNFSPEKHIIIKKGLITSDPRGPPT